MSDLRGSMWQYYSDTFDEWYTIPNASSLGEAVEWMGENFANSGTRSIREVKLVPVGEPVEVQTDWS